MSRTYRRKNKKYYNTLEDFLDEGSGLWWRKYMKLTKKTEEGKLAEYTRYLRLFHSDNHEGNHYSPLVKWEGSSKRRAAETRKLKGYRLEGNIEFHKYKRYSNLWNWG
jgi:Fic family protein